MPSYSLSRSKNDDCDIAEYRMLSFVVYVHLYDDVQKSLLDVIVDRREEDRAMKMCDFCHWLSVRGIEYELAFKYVAGKGLLWNAKKYLNFLRLKARLES